MWLSLEGLTLSFYINVDVTIFLEKQNKKNNSLSCPNCIIESQNDADITLHKYRS